MPWERNIPKALETLKGIRDEKTSRLLTGEANRDLFVDVVAINQSLDQSAATVDLFKRIDAVDPVFAALIYDTAEDALLRTGEYALARKYLGDPRERLAKARHYYERGLEVVKGRAKEESAQRAFANIFRDNALRIITVLHQTGDEAAAREIQIEALKTLDEDSIRNAPVR